VSKRKLKLFERAADTFFGGGRDTSSKNRALNIVGQTQFTGPFGQYIKNQSVNKGFMLPDDKLSQKTGLTLGSRQRDYQDKEFLAKLSEAAQLRAAEGKGLNLIPVNLKKQQAAANNPSLVAAGLEGPLKSAMAADRDDIGLVKGALSQYRSDLGYYDLTKAQMEDMLNPKNVKKYVDTAIQYKPQLNKVVNQIASYKTDKNQPTKELVDLMTDYTDLVGGSNPLYNIQRALTFGHPSGIAANIDHYLRTGNQTAKMLSRDPKFLTKMQAEIGPLNIGKEKIDRGILAALRNTENKVTKSGISEMRKLFDMSGLQSILPGQVYNKMYLGMNNPELQMQFLRNAINKGSKPFGKLTQRDVQNIMFGNKTISDYGFNKGGEVKSFGGGGIFGANLLARLSNKLSPEAMELILATGFKATKPLMSPKNIKQNRMLNFLGPDKYRYRFVKSDVPGPRTSLQRNQEKEFFNHTTFFPERRL
jgi:hypothetical protein